MRILKGAFERCYLILVNPGFFGLVNTQGGGGGGSLGPHCIKILAFNARTSLIMSTIVKMYAKKLKKWVFLLN